MHLWELRPANKAAASEWRKDSRGSSPNYWTMFWLDNMREIVAAPAWQNPKGRMGHI